MTAVSNASSASVVLDGEIDIATAPAIRRFLLAATAYGLISTDFNSVNDPPPANGTIFDRLAAHGIVWKNYFTDLPGTGVIAAIPKKYPQSLAPISRRYSSGSTSSFSRRPPSIAPSFYAWPRAPLPIRKVGTRTAGSCCSTSR